MSKSGKNSGSSGSNGSGGGNGKPQALPPSKVADLAIDASHGAEQVKAALLRQ